MDSPQTVVFVRSGLSLIIVLSKTSLHSVPAVFIIGLFSRLMTNAHTEGPTIKHADWLLAKFKNFELEPRTNFRKSERRPRGFERKKSEEK